jgi:hypothetical protein
MVEFEEVDADNMQLPIAVRLAKNQFGSVKLKDGEIIALEIAPNMTQRKELSIIGNTFEDFDWIVLINVKTLRIIGLLLKVFNPNKTYRKNLEDAGWKQIEEENNIVTFLLKQAGENAPQIPMIMTLIGSGIADVDIDFDRYDIPYHP